MALGVAHGIRGHGGLHVDPCELCGAIGVSPFCLTYMCNSFFVVYLPIKEDWKLVWKWMPALKESKQGLGSKEEQKLLGGEKRDMSLSPNAGIGKEEEERIGETAKEWSKQEMAQLSFLICQFRIVVQFTFKWSLKYTYISVRSQLHRECFIVEIRGLVLF